MRVVGRVFKTEQTASPADVSELEPKDVDQTDALESATDFDLDKMKVDELKELALQSGIDIPKGAKKEEIIDLIRNSMKELSGGDL